MGGFQYTLLSSKKDMAIYLLLMALMIASTGAFLTESFTLERPHAKRGTQLFVSELHVPGYAQSKLAFLPETHSTTATTATTVAELSPSNQEYETWIPFDESNPLDGQALVYKTKNPLFTSQECQAIIDEAEWMASNQMDWTRNRHGNFPTTDYPLTELPQTLSFFRQALQERVYPLLAHQFGNLLPDASKLRVADGFVVKYDALGGQSELKPHRDGSVLSFNIALNPSHEYEGGGTWFESLDSSIRLEQGHVVSHASSLMHGGHGITSGKRYILVAFVILEGYDSWSMRFYNQVRNR